MSAVERNKLRALVDKVRRQWKPSEYTNRMPDETAQDWLEHARIHGGRHLANAPPAMRKQVAALILGRAA